MANSLQTPGRPALATCGALAACAAIAVCAALATLAACGRLGYDPIASAGPGDAGPPCDETFSAPRRVAELSVVGADDWAPFVSANGLELYFASWRLGGAGNSDLFVATRSSTDAPFGEPTALLDLNTADFESAPMTSPDGQTLYFISFSRNVAGGRDVWIARRHGDGFVDVDSFADLSANGEEIDVELTRDGLAAYVATSRAGGEGLHDLWRAERVALDAPFEALTPVLELSTPFDESSMSVSGDQLEIVFASDRPGGVGNLDLWLARRERADLPFGEPVNLIELNSGEDDSRPSLSPDGRVIYFNHAADEEGGFDSDIWIATRCPPP